MDEITDFNLSLQFVISGNSMYPILYISGNSRPKEEYVVEMLHKLNTGCYYNSVYTCLQNYAKEFPEHKEYINNILQQWIESTKKIIEEAEQKLNNELNDENELVVRPTQFIKFEGFPGNE